ncbi:MAG: sigma factor-like helix-turn-helix DNA-binding protein [Anaerolineae bacterium]
MSKKLLNLKVVIIDPDFYALRALNSYVAWDRRARISILSKSLEEAFSKLDRLAEVEYPDVAVLDPDLFPTPEALRDGVKKLHKRIKELAVVCLARRMEPHFVSAALDAGVKGYMLREEVGVHVVGALVYAYEHDLTVTRAVERMNHDPYDVRLQDAKLLPKEREYPEMTERIRQALWLCVIEGMSAQLAADEMGVSPHTIRSYIKEGYRILKAHDDTEYPEDMSPEEQAFMRFTALDEDEEKP